MPKKIRSATCVLLINGFFLQFVLIEAGFADNLDGRFVQNFSEQGESVSFVSPEETNSSRIQSELERQNELQRLVEGNLASEPASKEIKITSVERSEDEVSISYLPPTGDDEDPGTLYRLELTNTNTGERQSRDTKARSQKYSLPTGRYEVKILLVGEDGQARSDVESATFTFHVRPIQVSPPEEKEGSAELLENMLEISSGGILALPSLNKENLLSLAKKTAETGVEYGIAMVRGVAVLFTSFESVIRVTRSFAEFLKREATAVYHTHRHSVHASGADIHEAGLESGIEQGIFRYDLSSDSLDAVLYDGRGHETALNDASFLDRLDFNSENLKEVGEWVSFFADDPIEKILFRAEDFTKRVDLPLVDPKVSMDSVPNTFNYEITSMTPLLTHFRLDGTGEDASGNHFDGTVIGGAVVSTDKAPLQIPNAGSLEFDGVDDVVNVPYSPFYKSTEGMTVSAWFNPADLTKANQYIINNGSLGAGGYQLFLNEHGNPYLTGQVRVNHEGLTTLSARVPFTVLKTGWNHVAMTYDAATTVLNIYLNGKLEATSSLGAANVTIKYPYAAGAFEIGGLTPDQYYSNPKEYFKGRIDDVHVLGRALTLSELTQIASGIELPVALATFTTDQSDVTVSYFVNGVKHFETFAGVPLGMNRLTLKVKDVNGEKTLLWEVERVAQLPFKLHSFKQAFVSKPVYSELKIDWESDQRTRSTIEYGETETLGKSISEADFSAAAHSLKITDLKASTAYFYRVVTVDELGNKTLSEIKQFTTGERPAKFYIGPSGNRDALGTQDDPVDLQSALDHARAGDEILFKSGLYSNPDKPLYGTQGPAFTATLNGTAAAPITLRSADGEWAAINGGLDVRGDYVRIRNLEFTNTSTFRSSDASQGVDINGRPSGLGIFSHHTEVINNVIHDNGNGIYGPTGLLAYGNIIYNNGWRQTTAEGNVIGNGHGFYAQAMQEGTKTVENNFIANNYSTGFRTSTADSERVAYPVHFLNNLMVSDTFYITKPQYPELLIEGNLVYKGDGHISAGVVATSSVRNDVAMRNNYFGFSALVQFGGWHEMEFTGNTVVSPSAAMFLRTPADVTLPDTSLTPAYRFNENEYVMLVTPQPGSPGLRSTFVHRPGGTTTTLNYTFPQWQQATGLDLDSTYSEVERASLKVFVQPNRYETGRGTITVYNWGLQEKVAPDLSGLGYQIGDRYQLRYIANYFDDVVEGVLDGNPFEVSMMGHTIAQPIGDPGKNAEATPEFGAFLITKLPDQLSLDPAAPVKINATNLTLHYKVNGVLDRSQTFTDLKQGDNEVVIEYVNHWGDKTAVTHRVFVDSVSPVISNHTIQVGDRETVITWKTDEPSTTIVQYGLDAHYAATSSDPALSLDHRVVLTNLEINKEYHYRVRSQDAMGNETVSDDFHFRIPARNRPPSKKKKQDGISLDLAGSLERTMSPLTGAVTGVLNPSQKEEKSKTTLKQEEFQQSRRRAVEDPVVIKRRPLEIASTKPVSELHAKNVDAPLAGRRTIKSVFMDFFRKRKDPEETLAGDHLKSRLLPGENLLTLQEKAEKT